MGILGRLKAAVTGSTYIDSTTQDWLDKCADLGEKRCSQYTLFCEYYDGDHGPMLRDRARAYLQRHGLTFCENFVEPVVDTVAERLELVGFTTDKAEQDTATGGSVDTVGEQLDGWWQQSRMDAAANTIHTRTLIQGDEFLIVDWDEHDLRPVFYRQQPHQIAVSYSEDDPDEIEYAVKMWPSEAMGPNNPDGKPVQRLNVYFPDRVEKWYRLSSGDRMGRGGWARWTDEGETGWPTPWQDAAGEPLGVPIVHFRYKPLGDTYGRSRAKAAIPFQDELNKYAADLNDLVDNHALPQDVVTGISGDSEYLRVPGEIWQTPSETAKFSRLEASPVANLLEAIEGVISRLARRTRMPMHLLTGGTPPSGEALKTAESGLVAVVKDCQVVFGNVWEDAFQLAVKLSDTFGDTAIGEVEVSVEWANPETRSDTADLDVALKKRQLGVSKHTLLNELGYDAQREKDLDLEETRDQVQAEMQTFDAGAVPARPNKNVL